MRSPARSVLRWSSFMLLIVPSTRALAECPEQTRHAILFHEFDAARAGIEAQLARTPSDAPAMDCMGQLLLEQGNAGGAMDWFNKAIAIEPKNAEHQLWLGRALGQYAATVNLLKRPFMARRCKQAFEKAVELDPAWVEARRSLGGFYAQAPAVFGGGIDKAREQAVVILKLNPMRGHIALGFIAEREQKFDSARKEYETAAALAPDSMAYAQMSLARMFVLKLQDFDEGEKRARAWLAAPPPDGGLSTQSTMHYLLGLAEKGHGHADRAKEEFKTALAANPRNTEAKAALASLK